MTQTELNTQRLCLRPLRDADAERLAHLANHREIAHMLATMPYPYTLDDAHEFIAQSKTEGEGAVFAIALAGRTDEMIGIIGYGKPRGEGKSADEIDFGYWLGLDFWGNGYASEAGHAVVQHAFEEGAVARIDTDYLIENPSSGRVLEKLGFEDMGERTCHSCGSGVTGASRHMRLTREAHQRLRDKQ